MESASVVPLTAFADRRHLTYPHASGWVGAGEALILAERRASSTAFVRHDVATGRCAVVGDISYPGYDTNKCRFFDVVGHQLVFVLGQSVWLIDLARAGLSPRQLVEFPANVEVGDIVSLHPDGSHLLAYGRVDGIHFCWELTLKTGALCELWKSAWHANHFHYVPHNPEWIGFSHEGPAHEISDRPWVMKAGAPETARCVFDQSALPRERRLNIGHELWAHHATTGLAVAYVGSPGRPRGLYEIFADGRPARLVSEGDRDWHANISRDGRWAVTDTSAPLDRSEIEFSPAHAGSDIVLVDMHTGSRRVLARTLSTPNHPAHPHPVFSPDGKHVYFNESTPDHSGYRVCRVSV